MITFNAPAMTADLKKALTLALVQLQAEVLADAEGKMLTPEGRADIEALPVADVAGVITAVIVGGPWATMDIFGKGSLMDSQNPFLGAYRDSNMWNPARRDFTIRSRPDASNQRNIFGEEVNGHGKGGYDLERLAYEEGKTEFMPHPPSHALQDAMRWVGLGRFQKVIAETLKVFPWGKYIIAKP